MVSTVINRSRLRSVDANCSIVSPGFCSSPIHCTPHTCRSGSSKWAGMDRKRVLSCDQLYFPFVRVFHLFQDALGSLAIGALEISEFDYRDRSVRGALNGIVLPVPVVFRLRGTAPAIHTMSLVPGLIGYPLAVYTFPVKVTVATPDASVTIELVVGPTQLEQVFLVPLITSCMVLFVCAIQSGVVT